ncbi:MAG TPA: hypothetical protein PLS23_20715, partial [Phycisphaerae bacterium]|nr:hypothetical protein [Phycisphaerae bacterium]
TIDPLCATPDPEALVIGDTVNISGITGLAWIFTKAKSATGTVCKLYMVNAGPGGDSSPPNSPWAVHATIDMAAQPSGWYRLRINYNNGTVTASGAGQTVNFSTTPNLVGGAFIGYRESVTGIPSFLRPATFDTAP